MSEQRVKITHIAVLQSKGGAAMRTVGCLAWIGITAVCASAGAQVVPPFFSGGTASFEPEIGIVQSGVVQDVQAVVSPDRKYVTLNMQVQNTNLLALRDFTFQTSGTGAPLGVVGIPVAAASTGGGQSSARSSPSVAPSAIATARAANAYVLMREGIFRIGDAP
jgi:hypothetical protein